MEKLEEEFRKNNTRQLTELKKRTTGISVTESIFKQNVGSDERYVI